MIPRKFGSVFLGTAVLCILLAGALLAQLPKRLGDDEDRTLPSGKSQREEILKAEHKKSLEDVKELVKLANELEHDLETNDFRVFSISSLKKAEQIEKLAHRIKGRVRR